MERNTIMHKRHVSTITALTLSASLLTACGGGGGSSPVPTAPVVTPNGKTQTAITFAIPGKKTGAARKGAVKSTPRGTHTAPQGYASRSVQSVSISFGAHNAAIPAVGSAPTFATNLTPNENSNETTCTGTDASGAYSCTVLVAAPVGFDDFIISEWDQPNGNPGSSPVAPSGNVLAIWNSLNDATYANGVAIQQNQVNTPNIQMAGVVSSAQTTLTTTSLVSGTAGSTVVGVTALDADGNVITGNLQWVDPSGAAVTLQVTGTPSCTAAKPCSPVGSADASDFTGLSANFNTPLDSDTVTYTPASANSLANVSFALSTASFLVNSSNLYGATLQFTQTNQGGVNVPGATQAAAINGGTCLSGAGAWNAILGSDGNEYVNNGYGAFSGALVTQVTPSGTCSYAQTGVQTSWIAAGADGDIWYVDNSSNVVGKFSPAAFNGVATDILIGGPANAVPASTTGSVGSGTLHNAVAGADGKMYVTDDGGNIIIVNPQDMSSQSIAVGGQPAGIAKGPTLSNGHGTIWWTDDASNAGQYSIDYMDIVTRTVTPIANVFTSVPGDLVVGTDGQMYVALQNNAIAAVNTTGVTHTYATAGFPVLLAIGPDKNVWFGESNGSLGRIAMPASGNTGALSEFGTTTGLPGTAPVTGVVAGSDHNLYANDFNNGAYMLTLP